MIFDILRFNLFALDLLNQAPTGGKEISIGEYLDREGYGDGFKEDYLLVRFHRSYSLTTHISL
jgi:predicted NAD/FAD-binding protein